MQRASGGAATATTTTTRPAGGHRGRGREGAIARPKPEGGKGREGRNRAQRHSSCSPPAPASRQQEPRSRRRAQGKGKSKRPRALCRESAREPKSPGPRHCAAVADPAGLRRRGACVGVEVCVEVCGGVWAAEPVWVVLMCGVRDGEEARSDRGETCAAHGVRCAQHPPHGTGGQRPAASGPRCQGAAPPGRTWAR